MDVEVPEEIKTIVDKTAAFVARIGPEFEQRILQNEQNNPKFSFLHSTDPYNFYYQRQLQFFREEEAKKGALTAVSSAASSWTAPSTEAPLPPSEEPGMVTETIKQEAAIQMPKHGPNSLAQRVLQVQKKIREEGRQVDQPPPFIFIHDLPKDINALDLDVIKLTAQFVARNGHQFQAGLLNRESKNPQFDFLKPHHAMNEYFIGLVESYTRCLNPPKNIVEGLAAVFGDRHAILDRIVLRHEWEEQQEKNKKSKEEQEEEDRIANQMIDWHDFVIVETITFDDEMAQPTVPLMPAPMPQAQMEDTSAEMETEDVEMDVDEPKPKPSSEMRIRKDYVKPALGAKAGPKFQRCPRCGMDVPTDQMDEHVRIELLDPKYRLQRQNIADRGKGLHMASDDEITRNLATFARRRTDIFESEADLGKPSTAEEDHPSEDKLIWDGHTGSIPQKVAPVKTEEPKKEPTPLPTPPRATISSSMPGGPPPPLSYGPPMVSSSMPGPPQMMPPQPPRMGMPQPPISSPPVMNVPFRPPPPGSIPPMGVVNIPLPVEGEPNAKKQKLAEDTPVQLIPEEQFLKTHNGQFTARVQCPQEDEKPEWKLQGQTISITINYTDTVKTLKEKIKDQVGIPPNKQKLKGNGQHLKDQPTMAFYNFTSNTPIALSIRERGGKK